MYSLKRLALQTLYLNFVLAMMAALAAADEPALSVLELPAIEGQAGPQIAVRWDGALPVTLEIGAVTEHAFTRIGQPLELTAAMTLLPRPGAGKEQLVYRILDKYAATLAEVRIGTSSGPGWQSLFSGPGMDRSAVGRHSVRAATVYQGELVVGGTFRTAGAVEVNRIARWNGTRWARLDGPDAFGVQGVVNALAVFNGELIAAGNFIRAGSLVVNRIARWDGTVWSTLEGPSAVGVNNEVDALAIHDGALIVGGNFTTAGGITVNRIARWNGMQWSALSGPSGTGITGFSVRVHALSTYNGELIAGGNFFFAGGVPVSRIARWNGSEWAALPGPSGEGVAAGLDSSHVEVLTVFDNELIVGGLFTSAGGLPAANIARWDGGEWLPLIQPVSEQNGTNALVSALEVYDGALIVGGQFSLAGGLPALRIARWTGSQWSDLSAKPGDGFESVVDVLAVFENTLYAGGQFLYADGNEVNHIARLDTGTWAAVPILANTTVDSWISALAIYEGDLVAAGGFTAAGGEPASYVARWNGSQWSPLGTGLNWTVNALTVFNSELVAGGWFGSAGGDHIARFDGSEWVGLGGGTNAVVWALLVWEDALIAGGAFTTAGGTTVNHVARWDGNAWSALSGTSGLGVSSGVFALTEFNGDLIVGGQFSSAGGISTGAIARYNGTDWFSMTAGMNDRVSALTTYDGDLIAGGNFTMAGGVTVNGIARWDGSEWAALEGSSGLGVDFWVFALHEYQGELIVGGSFFSAGGNPANNIARWSGSEWSTLSGPLNFGVNASVRALAVFDNQLIAGGEFTSAGGLASRYLGVFHSSDLSIGGTVTGLKLPGLVLDLNGVSSLLFDRDGPFTFPGTLADGSNYQVSLVLVPRDHDCTVANGSGTINGASVNHVEVNCQTDIVFADRYKLLRDQPVALD